MHTVGKEVMEKGLVPLEVLNTTQAEEVPEAKPLKKPSRKKAGKAMQMVAAKRGQPMSVSKLELKDMVGRFMGGKNGMRGVVIADTLISLDTVQDVMLEIRDEIKQEPDMSKKIRAARAVGELAGQMSSLLTHATNLQEKINLDEVGPKKRSTVAPTLHFHQHGGAGNQTEPSHQSPLQQATGSPSLSTPNPQDGPHNTGSDASRAEPQDAPSPQGTLHQPESENTSPDGSDDTANRGPRPLGRETPPWEGSGEEF